MSTLNLSDSLSHHSNIQHTRTVSGSGFVAFALHSVWIDADQCTAQSPITKSALQDVPRCNTARCRHRSTSDIPCSACLVSLRSPSSDTMACTASSRALMGRGCTRGADSRRSSMREPLCVMQLSMAWINEPRPRRCGQHTSARCSIALRGHADAQGGGRAEWTESSCC